MHYNEILDGSYFSILDKLTASISIYAIVLCMLYVLHRHSHERISLKYVCKSENLFLLISSVLVDTYYYFILFYITLYYTIF